MRNAFAEEIHDLASQDKRIVLLTADIGNRLFDKYKADFSERFFNCGIAEANMVSMAAGMASEGLRPVCYTITPFITTRCLEQIRVDVCYHRVPVILVGTGSGLSYASLGATHHSCEDIGMLRLLPHMSVLCPGDALEVKACLEAAIAHPDPVYLRLGKKNEPAVYAARPRVQIGKAITIREGGYVCLLGTGNMLHTALQAAHMLGEHGVSAKVVSFHTVKPLDESLLGEIFQCFPVVVTLEEHSILGGLGGSVAEWMSGRTDLNARLLRVGTEDEFLHETTNQELARRHYGLTAENTADRVLEALGNLYLTSVR